MQKTILQMLDDRIRLFEGYEVLESAEELEFQ